MVAGIVVVGGLAAWLLWPHKAAPAADPAAAAAPSSPATAPAAPPAPEVMTAAPAQAEVMPPPDGTAPAPTTAPKPVTAPAPATIDLGPREPVLDFEPLPPTPGISAEQADEWASLVHAYFIEDPPPRQALAMKDTLDAIDIVDVTPQFINVLDGLDMSADIDIRNAWKLVRYWHDREGEKMHFAFSATTGAEATQKDVDNRVIAIEGWRQKWKLKLDDPALLQEFRLLVGERLQDRKSKADAEDAADAAGTEGGAGG